MSASLQQLYDAHLISCNNCMTIAVMFKLRNTFIVIR
jgi:hypothetical protein